MNQILCDVWCQRRFHSSLFEFLGNVNFFGVEFLDELFLNKFFYYHLLGTSYTSVWYVSQWFKYFISAILSLFTQMSPKLTLSTFHNTQTPWIFIFKKLHFRNLYTITIPTSFLWQAFITVLSKVQPQN